MVSVEGVTKVFADGQRRVVALDDVSFEVQPGEVFGIIGLSGAGKSTLVRCINLLERPDRGRVRVDGVDMTGLSPQGLRQARRRIGMIFQHFNLLRSRTAYGNVAFPLEVAGVPKDRIERRVRELLELVGLADRADAYPAQLSGGQKQRVGIARALANEPHVLLCDEPTSALDPQTTGSILELLRQINRELGLTIVLITHEMGVVQAICHRVAVMEEGQVAELGETAQVLARPRSEAARRLVRASAERALAAARSAVSGAAAHEATPGRAAEGLQGEARAEDLARARGQGQAQGPAVGGAPLYRLTFFGPVAQQPVVARMIKRFEVVPNILFADLDRVQETTHGTLVVAMEGEPAEVERALAFLRAQGVEVAPWSNGAGEGAEPGGSEPVQGRGA